MSRTPRPTSGRVCLVLNGLNERYVRSTVPAAQRPRRWLVYLLLWLALTSLATFLHWAQWNAPNHTPPSAAWAQAEPLRITGNVVYTLNLPAWVVALWTYPPARYGPAIFAFIAYGLGWACWLGLIAGVLRLRRWLARPRNAVTADAQGDAPANLSRRALFVNTALGAGAVAVTAPVAYGTLIEPWSLRVTKYTLPIRELPSGLCGLRLAVFADPHVGPRVPDEFIARAVRATLDLKPDVILMLGDYVHAVAPQAQKAASLLAPLVAGAVPVLAVRGNHDWRKGVDLAGSALHAIGVRLVDNERVFLDESHAVHDEPPADGRPVLCIAGLGDLHEHVVDVHRAMRAVPPTCPRIFIAHQPSTALHKDLRAANQPGGPRVDLMISGHTHGGQIVLPLLGTPAHWIGWMDGYTRGVDTRLSFPVVVSSGIGLSLIPVRIGAPPEILEITLECTDEG